MVDFKDYTYKMDRTLEVLQEDFGAVRAGRANARVLDRISVEYYGVDTPEKSQLIASRQTQDEICEFVGADSLRYLSIDGLMQAVKGEQGGYCAACFDGKYPTPLFGLDTMPKGNIRGL